MRTIINTKQVQNSKTYFFNGRPILFNKDSGYNFSDHSAMDACVEYFLSLEGFELVSKKKDAPKVKEAKEGKKSSENKSKGFFNKKKKEEPKEEVVEEVKEEVVESEE